MSGSQAESIYEKFKENTQKIFNDQSFKESLDKGHQMLRGKHHSKNSTIGSTKGQVCYSPILFVLSRFILIYTSLFSLGWDGFSN